MAMMACRFCGNMELSSKEVEIRQINSFTMRLASLQKIVEFECPCCGWVGSDEGPIERSPARLVGVPG